MSQFMRALVLTDHGPTVESNRQRPQPGPVDALIRVDLAGICSTDLELIAGYKGSFRGVLGHEFVGTVVDAPAGPEWLGQRVVGEISISCGVCARCRAGVGKHCRSRRALGISGHDGAFADYIVLPLANLHPVPDDLPDRAAIFVEPLAAALQVLEQIHIEPHMRVYQLGDGRLGLLLAQVLSRTGCDFTLIGRSESKERLAHQLDVTKTVRSGTPEWQALHEASADLVIEVTGSREGFTQALALLRPGGTLVLKSTYARGLAEFDLSRLVVDEITLVGSRCGPFAAALRLLSAGQVVTEPLISAEFSLEESLTALQVAVAPGVVKVLIDPRKGETHG